MGSTVGRTAGVLAAPMTGGLSVIAGDQYDKKKKAERNVKRQTDKQNADIATAEAQELQRTNRMKDTQAKRLRAARTGGLDSLLHTPSPGRENLG